MVVTDVSGILALNKQLYCQYSWSIGSNGILNIMGIKTEVRLYSSELYIAWDKVAKVGIGASNRTVLAKHSGIKYGKLRYIFCKLGLDFYEDEEYIIMKIDTGMIFKRKDKKVMRGSEK